MSSNKGIYRLKVIGTTLSIIKCGIALLLLVKSENIKEGFKIGHK